MFMRLTTPFTALRNAIKREKLATERLHDDYRKMFKSKKHPTIVNGYV